jgi:hypothetical protein
VDRPVDPPASHTHRTEYGYRSELGDHEIWAECPPLLAQAMLGAAFTFVGRERLLGTPGPLQIVDAPSLNALKRCASGAAKAETQDPAEGLPSHVFVRVRFGQWEPKTPETIATYKLVVRETFRSVRHG